MYVSICLSSVVTVTFILVVSVVRMKSFDAEIRGRVSSLWSLGVPIFFHVDLDRRLQDTPVSTKNGNFRLLMVTGTDGDDVVVSSSLLMVGFVTRLTLDDFCFVMQAASMYPFLPLILQTGLDSLQSLIAWPFFPQQEHCGCVLDVCLFKRLLQTHSPYIITEKIKNIV